MLLKKQRNILFNILQNQILNSNEFREKREEDSYELSIYPDEDEYYFYIETGKSITGYIAYEIKMRSGNEEVVSEYSLNDFESILHFFRIWATALKEELDTPDLWAEAAKTAQLFAPTATPSDDKFTRAELAEVQGQLRLLQQSFTTVALPEAARQQLIKLTQTAAVKAEGLTKKDWQNWIIGGFIGAITNLALNPTQAADVLKLVKAAFGGLFLH